MNLSKILNELISVEEIPEKFDVIYWNNGIITFQPNFSALENVIFRVDQSKKQLQFWAMDDWSEIRRIKKIQQALKDCVRAKIIDLNWNILIPNQKNTLRSLGSTKVKNILKLDFNFGKYIPYSFHGTSTRFLPYIEKNGLLARSQTKTKPNWNVGYTQFSANNIYLTIDYDRAKYYAQHTVESDKKNGIDSKPIVLKIKNLDSMFAIVDDDILTHKSVMIMQLLRTGKPVDKDNFIQGIRNTSQFAYMDDIPFNKISKIYKNL